MRTASLIALLSIVLFASLGCGRKATREDCDLIVDKRKLELRESLKDDIDHCVGKRVTNAMLGCVKSSDTPDQIDKCLR